MMMKQRILRYLKRTLTKQFLLKMGLDYLKFIGVIAVVIGIGFGLSRVFAIGTHVVIANNMSPRLSMGDLVVHRTKVNLDLLNPGDIITFNVDTNNNGKVEVLSHYVHTITTNQNGITVVFTHGENTTLPDAWTLTEDMIEGSYLFHLRMIGNFMVFINTWFGRFILLVNSVLIFILLKIWFKETDYKSI